MLLFLYVLYVAECLYMIPRKVLFCNIYLQVTQPLDYSNPHTIKNHNEVLRCYAVLNSIFSDRVISFLLERLNQPQEKNKMGALTIMRHLVNSGGEHMEEKKALILSGLKMVIHDTNNKVCLYFKCKLSKNVAALQV